MKGNMHSLCASCALGMEGKRHRSELCVLLLKSLKLILTGEGAIIFIG